MNNISRAKEAESEYRRGLLLEYQGNLIQAIGCYRRALRIFPDLDERSMVLNLTEKQRYRRDLYYFNINSEDELVDSIYESTSSSILDERNQFSESITNTNNRSNIQVSLQHFFLVRKNFLNSMKSDSMLNIIQLLDIDKWDRMDISTATKSINCYSTYLILNPLIFGEIMLYLDTFSCGILSTTCKYFNYLVKTSWIWEYKCHCIWGNSIWSSTFINSSTISKHYYYMLYLNHPRIRYDGIYISRCSYFRKIPESGNIHLDDIQRQRYMCDFSIIQVTYYRYLLFIANTNIVLILRSSQNPIDVVKYMKSHKLVSKYLQLVNIKDNLDLQIKLEDNDINNLIIGTWSFKSHEICKSEDSSDIIVRYKEYPTIINEVSFKIQGSDTNKSNGYLKYTEFKMTKINGYYSDSTYLCIDNNHFRSFEFYRIRSYRHLY
ncbi:TPR repeat-containing protein [Cryptosporidium andersoni]|uniref:TPR repeat-containing protein n=1 Tax=Cryptosporidium andersoni TaxID=117008 RepID=A0A1J4MPT7_9CRYT|nr:TPR repeat-containing protein [Cryptosporidium andersoni]